VTKFIKLIVTSSVTPKAAPSHEVLFSKPALGSGGWVLNNLFSLQIMNGFNKLEFCHRLAFPAYCNATLWLIRPMHKLRRKLSVVNTTTEILTIYKQKWTNQERQTHQLITPKLKFPKKFYKVETRGSIHISYNNLNFNSNDGTPYFNKVNLWDVFTLSVRHPMQ